MNNDTLVAAAVIIQDGPPDVVARTYKALANGVEQQGGRVLDHRPGSTTLAFEDQLAAPRLLDALAREARTRQDLDLRVAAHLGVRVRSAAQPGLALGERCMQTARALVAAAQRNEMLVSDELGMMMGFSQNGRASRLAPVQRHAEALGTVRAYRYEPDDALMAPTWQPTGLLPDSPALRARLGSRLGALFTTDLGPIAPILLPDLVSRALRTDEIIDGVQRYLPPTRNERVRELVEREVRRLSE